MDTLKTLGTFGKFETMFKKASVVSWLPDVCEGTVLRSLTFSTEREHTLPLLFDCSGEESFHLVSSIYFYSHCSVDDSDNAGVISNTERSCATVRLCTV